MKKLIVLAFLVTASLTACGKKPAPEAPKSDAKMEPAPAPAEGEAKPDEGMADKKEGEGETPAADPCAAPQ